MTRIVTLETRRKISEAQKGKPRVYQRKEKLTSYRYIHHWNNKHYPKTGKCVECGTEGKRTEWALIHGKEHTRGIENYKELCKKCHIAYDMTPEWKEKTRKVAWMNNPRYCALNPKL